MFSSILALLVRALRQDSRLLASHLLRLLFVGVICWSLWMTITQMAWLGSPGLAFFSSITYVNFFLITLAGGSFFATAITEEKDEGTLGLLRMTGMSSLSLLLGKSSSRLIIAALLLSVQFPFTWLAITLGWITSRQVVAGYVVLLS